MAPRSQHILESFSNLIDLREFFLGIDNYAILKLPEYFPNYYDYEDIDILCENTNAFEQHILKIGKKYIVQGFKLQINTDSDHRHIDFYAPGASKLNFRFDLLGSLDGYKKIVVNPHYHLTVLTTKRKIVHNDVEVSVPALEHDLAIRFLEYFEYFEERPSKIKHMEYIQQSKNITFFDLINKHTNLDISLEDSKGRINLKYKPEVTSESFCVMKSRMDYFLIWGHGILYTSQILDILRNYEAIEIITIIRKKVDDMAQFVQDIYACDTVPFHHLLAKTRYLLTANPEIIFVLVKNKNAHEKYFGEGPFRHIQCQHIKNIKEEIRNKFNPRIGDKRTEDHVVHASDYESQVEYVLKLLGLNSLEYYSTERNPSLCVPYHLGKIDHYDVKEVKIDSLCASIVGRGLVSISDTPHYSYVAGKMADYILYHQKYFGIELTDDHFPDAFDKMINNFSYNDIAESGKQNLIIAKIISNGRYQILDGVHRAAILTYRGISSVKIAIVSQGNSDCLEATELKDNKPVFVHSVAQAFEKKFSHSWLEKNFLEKYELIKKSIDMFMCSGTLSIGREQALVEFFQGKEELWQKFINQVIDKNCLEIGSGPCSIASYWHFIRKWNVIDPLADEYKQMTLNMFGKTWWWHWINTHSQNAETLLPELVGRIDGVIVCRNTLDHADDPNEVLNNISRYASPGCKLLLWTDIYHTRGHDNGHRNLCKSKNVFRDLITNRGFLIDYETPSFRQGETIEFGCVATKN